MATEKEKEKAKWEARLAREGLGEKLPAGRVYGGISDVPDAAEALVQVEARAEYYRCIEEGCSHHPFTDDIDRVVMLLHLAGRSNGEITKALRLFGWSRDKHNITHVIRRYEQIWGIKNWDIGQLRAGYYNGKPK